MRVPRRVAYWVVVGGLLSTMQSASPQRKMRAPSETFLAPNFAICAAGSPFACPFRTLKSLTSTYIPSLLASCPSPLGELEVQVSLKLFIRGEFCHCATANVEPDASAAATPMVMKLFLAVDIAFL